MRLEIHTEGEQGKEALWTAKNTTRSLLEALEQAEFYLESYFEDKEEQVKEWLSQAQVYKEQLDSFFDQIKN